MPLFRELAKNMAPMTNADESPTNRLTLFPIYLSLFVVSTLPKAWFSYVADDRRVIVSDHSRRKFTKDFTHEQSPTIVVADVGDI